MIIPVLKALPNGGTGYIAGTNDGIVTVNGVSARRRIYVFDAESFSFITTVMSLPNGRYFIAGLNPNKKYLVMARDYNREYEPAVFDYVTPATDLTVQQQQELWESWQTK